MRSRSCHSPVAAVNGSLPRAQWGIAAVLRWLALLMAGCVVFSPVALAAPARSNQSVQVIADNGFTPTQDGYAFPNYGAPRGVPNLGSDELRQLFGDGVCAGFSGEVCVLSPPALAWMHQENALMAEGHCVGFSITALFFFAHWSSPVQFGAAAVPRLAIARNQLLAREIAYGYSFQVLDSVRRAEVSSSPRRVLAKLVGALRTGRELYTLGITQPDGFGGHAVTPYKVERLGPGQYAILVYDNDYPSTTRAVNINTKTDTWSYNAAGTPNQPGSLYTGNVFTHSLLLLPTSPGLGVQPCPFCSATSTLPSTTPTAPPRLGTAQYDAVRLQTAGPGTGHLLITDSRGRRIGFAHGRLIDQIPGARIVNQFVAGPRTWLDSTEPEYEIPVGQRYRIELMGKATASTSGPSQASLSSRDSVTVLEPGFLAAVRGIQAHPGQQDQLALSRDGHAISFLPQGGGRQAPELVVGNAAPGRNDHEWNITDAGAPSGRQISASLNLPKDSMILKGPGTYDLSMDLVGNGVSVFAHSHFHVGAGVTAHFDYANWAAGQSMPVTETKDGKVIGTQLLSDQLSPTDTGSEFEPSEPTPAPAEPPPRPGLLNSTATTLTCLPVTVPVGDGTTCTVDVSGLQSDTSGTPTGDVSFSSDSSGSFSSAGCTLLNGSCEVAYTPSAVGSGTHQLTASYIGDDTHARSGATDAVGVTLRSTGTSFDCSPREVAEHSPTACTVTVSDSGTGNQTTPTGAVSFSSNGRGSFSIASCVLSNGSCEVTYTPSAVGTGRAVLTASYGGDGTHAQSENAATVEVKHRNRTARGRDGIAFYRRRGVRTLAGTGRQLLTIVKVIRAGAEALPSARATITSV